MPKLTKRTQNEIKTDPKRPKITQSKRKQPKRSPKVTQNNPILPKTIYNDLKGAKQHLARKNNPKGDLN